MDAPPHAQAEALAQGDAVPARPAGHRPERPEAPDGRERRPEPGSTVPSAWRTLLVYARPFRAALLAGGLLSLATGAVGLALPLVARRLVDDLASDRAVGGALGLLVALALVNAAIGALGSYVLDHAAESVVLSARRRLVAHLLRLRIAAVDRSEPGDLMARVTADTTLLREVTTRSLVSVATSTLMLLATVTMMALLDPLLLAVTVGVLGGAQVVIRLTMPRIARAATDAQAAVGVMGAALERVLGAVRTVKAAGAEHQERQRVDQAATQAWRAGLRAARWEAVAGNTAGLAIQTAFIVVLGLGGARVASGAIDVGPS